MKLGTKISLGFAGLIVIAVVLGGAGYYNAVRNGDSIYEIGGVRLPSVHAMQDIKVAGSLIKAVQRTLLNPDISAAVVKRQHDFVAQAQTLCETAVRTYEPLPKATQEAALWTEFKSTWNQWGKENAEFLRLEQETRNMKVGDPRALRADLERFRGDHYKLEVAVSEAIDGKQIFEGGEDPAQCNFGKWRAVYKAENPEIQAALQQIDVTHKQFHESVKKVKNLIKAGEVPQALAAYKSEIKPNAEKTIEQFDRMNKVAAAAQQLAGKTFTQAMETCRPSQLKAEELLDQLTKTNLNLANETTKGAMAQVSFVKLLSITSVIAALALGIILAVFIIRSITGPVRRIADTLGAGADQTAAAAGQVSAASQSLAQGASEQAAALEETSSSLEEISSMTRKNSDGAQQASALSAEAKTAAEKGNHAMQKMSSAINDIQKSATATAKIIKVIDEIAFQTNLLALNAAVEAARAGEAGKGFAVVAEEVRNLAMRSAEAAKNTSAMIEESVNNARNGVTITQEVAKNLEEITAAASKVNALVSEISAGSQEQTTGLDQVNKAVGEMDKVTQSNAATAEESAGASEELSSQAEQMRGIVGELIILVNGASAGGMAGPSARSRHPQAANKTTAAHKAVGRKASDIIPLQEHEARHPGADFADFSKAA